MGKQEDMAAEALRKGKELLAGNPFNPGGHRLLGVGLSANHDQAALHLCQALLFSDEEAPVAGSNKLAAWMDWANLSLMHRHHEQASLICRLAIAAGADSPFFADTLDKLHGRHLPPIFINTMHKSASLFLRTRLQQALGLPRTIISSWSDWRLDLLLPGRLRAASRGWAFCREHAPASPYNLQVASRYLERMVLHVRDPRQASLSAFHFLQQAMQDAPRQGLGTFDFLPPEFADWDREKRLDWFLEYDLPQRMKWLEDWLAAMDDPAFTPQVLLTRFEQLVEDPRGLFGSILEFHGLADLLDSVDTQRPEEGRLHFRKGGAADWRQEMTSGQLDACARLCHGGVMRRMGWES